MDYNPEISVDLGNDTTLCDGETVELFVDISDATISWQDGTMGPAYTITQPGIYWVEVANDCNSITATIAVDNNECGCAVVVPNAFSPNGDGINDGFTAKPQCEFTDYYLAVFNRWGTKVFETTTLTESWDGTVGGTPQEIGTYIYLIKYQSVNEGLSKTKYGNVTLVR